MGFQSLGGIRFFSFEIFNGYNVHNAVLTRAGGVSRPPYASLNLGGTVGDQPAHVNQNKQIAFNAFGLTTECIYEVWQVHGDEVVCTDRPRQPGEPHLKADVILTNAPGVSLLMRFADCVPIFLFDPVRRVAGLAHAGWKGTVLKTAQRAVEGMSLHYGSRPGDILAAIGPSIAAHHYQIGEDVGTQVRNVFQDLSSELLSWVNGGSRPGYVLDLWAANRLILEQAGVKDIEIAGLCTACNLNDWYSYRAEDSRTGRFGALIALQP